jgi:hypothetical protein
MDQAVPQQDAKDIDPVRPLSFHRWERGKEAEYEKLMSHIVVLRERVRRLRAKSRSGGQSDSVQGLVDQALKEQSWLAGREQAHRYADSLAELVLLIADKPYLTAVFDHELSHANPTEPITLNTLFESDDLRALRVACNTEASPQPEHRLCQNHVAEVLRLLFKSVPSRCGTTVSWINFDIFTCPGWQLLLRSFWH